jgi:hypothetical protein
MRNVLILLSIIFYISVETKAQPIPPCGNDYGTTTDENNIITQMRYGTIIDARDAINQAKNSRGNALGCPQDFISYVSPNFSEPSLASIENVWNNVHAPAISSFIVSCPRIGRYENNAALGAYYAMLAGYYNDTSKLNEIADMMYDQQYVSWNIANPSARNKGVYGYLHVNSSDPCYPGGVVGNSVSLLCANLPSYCVQYNGGQFAGEYFAISGQDDANSWFDGGLAYDHGWVGIQMIESAIQQNIDSLKQKYRNSVVLASEYAISEYCVKNHNYTAKLIWLLAEMYAWTGDSIYKNELNYKLNKNLIPGILWDGNNNNFVDGTNPPISFDSLNIIAQNPGRMWDGHNSLPWYHAMNTWAMIESYVAFRDRGDSVRANELKPYAITMLDNLAIEIINQGLVTPNVLGVRDITYALLIGIWKISQYENEAHPNWEQAAWAMWNSGYFNSYSTHSVCVGLYLVIKTAIPYVPLKNRENFYLTTANNNNEKQTIKIFPNPTENYIYVVQKIENSFCNKYKIFDTQGKELKNGVLRSTKERLSTSFLPSGSYTICFYIDNKQIQSKLFIKQ